MTALSTLALVWGGGLMSTGLLLWAYGAFLLVRDRSPT